MISKGEGALFSVDDVVVPDHYLDTRIEIVGWTAKYGRRAKFYCPWIGYYLDRLPSITVERIRDELGAANEHLGFEGKSGREPLDILRYGRATSYQQCVAAVVATNLAFEDAGFTHRIGRGSVACSIYFIWGARQHLNELFHGFDKDLEKRVSAFSKPDQNLDEIEEVLRQSKPVREFCKDVSARLADGKRFSPELLAEIYVGRQVTFATAYELLESLRAIPALAPKLGGQTGDHIEYRLRANLGRAPASAIREEVPRASYATFNPFAWPFLTKDSKMDSQRQIRAVP